MGVKIILCTVTPDKEIFKKRIQDRLNLYPHYERILRDPDWYLEQQEQYKSEIKNSSLDYLEIDMTEIPNKKADDILQWIGEK